MTLLYALGAGIFGTLIVVGAVFWFGWRQAAGAVTDRLHQAELKDAGKANAARREVDGLDPAGVDQRLQPWQRR